MQSPPLEFTVMLGAPLLINLMRNAGDPDFDTISESVRRFRDYLDDCGLPGDFLIGVGITVGGGTFWLHICRNRHSRKPRRNW